MGRASDRGTRFGPRLAALALGTAGCLPGGSGPVALGSGALQGTLPEGWTQATVTGELLVRIHDQAGPEPRRIEVWALPESASPRNLSAMDWGTPRIESRVVAPIPLGEAPPPPIGGRLPEGAATAQSDWGGAPAQPPPPAAAGRGRRDMNIWQRKMRVRTPTGTFVQLALEVVADAELDTALVEGFLAGLATPGH